MKETKLLDRREFTLAAAMAMLGGVAIAVSACSKSGSSSPTAPTPTTTTPTTPGTPGSDKTGAISANHGHAAVVTSAQLAAGGGIALGIQGTADHAHSVTLAAADLTAIAANQRVSKDSTDGSGHSHTVTFN
jgi:hypothetical protein